MTTTFEQAAGIQVDKAALEIFDDLFTEEPTYNYDLTAAGKYARQLERLI